MAIGQRDGVRRHGLKYSSTKGHDRLEGLAGALNIRSVVDAPQAYWLTIAAMERPFPLTKLEL
jgi:hypothetical protein